MQAEAVTSTAGQYTLAESNGRGLIIPAEFGADVGRWLYRANILAFIAALDSAALPPPAASHSTLYMCSMARLIVLRCLLCCWFSILSDTFKNDDRHMVK